MIETKTFSVGTIGRLFRVPFRFLLDLLTDPVERAYGWQDRRLARQARARRDRQSYRRRKR